MTVLKWLYFSVLYELYMITSALQCSNTRKTFEGVVSHADVQQFYTELFELIKISLQAWIIV